MLCVFGEREREEACREAGRGKEGERGSEAEGRAVQRGAERRSPCGGRGVGGRPGTATAECCRLEGCPQHAHPGASLEAPLEALSL